MRKVFLFLLMAMLVLLPLQQVLAFTDVDENTPFAEAIAYLYETGVVQGYPDGSFKAGRDINRAEFLKIVLEASGRELEDPETACFDDVDVDEWYSTYVCSAKNLGIVEGYSDGTFGPANTINMAEAMKMTLLTFGYDLPETDPWYNGPMDQADALDMLPETYTGVGQLVNRGEMAQIMFMLLQAVPQGHELDENETEILEYMNDYREELGLELFQDKPAMNLAALNHSIWMEEEGELNHYEEDGSSMYDRCQAVGTVCYGEILAMNSLEDTAMYLEQWKNSPTHDALLKTPEYRYVGIGVYEGYATVVFSN